MNKQEIYDYLDKKNIHYEITNHKPVYNMEELSDISLPYPRYDAKNIFLCDDKKRNYYLLTIKGDKRVNLKEFRKNNNLRPLTFASEEALLNILNLCSGSVSPLGLLNDKNHQVIFYIDEYFLEENLIGVHPNDNTATIWLKAVDLVNIIKELGNTVHIIKV